MSRYYSDSRGEWVEISTMPDGHIHRAADKLAAKLAAQDGEAVGGNDAKVLKALREEIARREKEKADAS